MVPEPPDNGPPWQAEVRKRLLAVEGGSEELSALASQVRESMDRLMGFPAAPPITLGFRGLDGVMWQVREVPAQRFGHFVTPPSLIFMSAGCARRVYSYPKEWRTLDAAALDSLSKGR
jgi:hypothetical protein